MERVGGFCLAKGGAARQTGGVGVAIKGFAWRRLPHKMITSPLISALNVSRQVQTVDKRKRVPVVAGTTDDINPTVNFIALVRPEVDTHAEDANPRECILEKKTYQRQRTALT